MSLGDEWVEAYEKANPMMGAHSSVRRDFARWLVDNLDKLGAYARYARDPYPHADGSRECRPVEDAKRIDPPLSPFEPEPERTVRPDCKVVDLQHMAREIAGKSPYGSLTWVDIVNALRRGMELSDPDAEKRGMMKVVDYFRDDGKPNLAERIRRHFGLGEK